MGSGTYEEKDLESLRSATISTCVTHFFNMVYSDVIAAHVANVWIRETIKIKLHNPNVRWNYLFMRGGGDDNKTETTGEMKEKDAVQFWLKEVEGMAGTGRDCLSHPNTRSCTFSPHHPNHVPDT